MVRIMLSCFILALTTIACAPFSQTESPSTLSEQQLQTDAICVDIMGLWTGEVYYPRCEEGVAYVLAAKAKRQEVVTAYKGCLHRDLKEGHGGVFQLHAGLYLESPSN